MNTYEVMSTEENLLRTLKEDTIKRNNNLIAFYHLLQAQEVNSSIAIDGRWGCGKTFFVKHMIMLIEAMNSQCKMEDDNRKNIIRSLAISSSDEQKMTNNDVTIYYDAWRNDNNIDPVFSIIYEITKQFGLKYEFNNPDLFKAAASILDIIKGWNINEMINHLKGDDPLTYFRNQDELYDKIKIFFQDILKERGNRLIVFIDELDRCKPSYAVNLLEQVKHFLSMDNVTFVFSVNIKELQHTIKSYYGDSFDACRYLDRFFNLRIGLSSVNMNMFLDEIGFEDKYLVDRICIKFMKKYDFEMREVSRFYCQVKASVYMATHDTGKWEFRYADEIGRKIILTFIVPIIIGLRLVDSNEYNKFINGKDPQILIELFDSKLVPDSYLKIFLDSDEALMKNDAHKKYVSREEILKRLYETVFLRSENDDYRKVGSVEFNAYSKQLALDASNMMSQYADMDI